MAETTQGRMPPHKVIPNEVREHFRTARQEIRAGIKALLPPEVMKHGRKARKEMLLAWRGVIDAALEHLDDKSDER